jgi:hypothetical protein
MSGKSLKLTICWALKTEKPVKSILVATWWRKKWSHVH